MNELDFQDIVSKIVRNAMDVSAEAKKNPEDSFLGGRYIAYYEVLDTIKNQLIVREADLSEYGLDINLEKEYL